MHLLFYSPDFNKVFLSFSVLFPFLMPLIEALEIEFFPRDAQSFFKNVVQQIVEGRKETGQVIIVYFLSKLLIFLKVTKRLGSYQNRISRELKNNQFAQK